LSRVAVDHISVPTKQELQNPAILLKISKPGSLLYHNRGQHAHVPASLGLGRG